MPLTERAIRNAKRGDKSIRLFDGGSMYLEIAPSGGKWCASNIALIARKSACPLACFLMWRSPMGRK